MSTDDGQIGRNLTRLRGELSQKDLAARMRERGWKWSQATVWSIEKGERPLRLAEAEEIATIFQVGIFGLRQLAAPDPEAETYIQMRRIHGVHLELEVAIEAFLMAQTELAIAADSAVLPGRVPEGIADWLSMTPETVTDDLRARWKAENDASDVLTYGSAEEAQRRRERRPERDGKFWQIMMKTRNG